MTQQATQLPELRASKSQLKRLKAQGALTTNEATNLLTLIDTNRLFAYENGLLDEAEIIKLFQELINTDLIDHLQGHYGRTAARLIAEDACTPKGYVKQPTDDEVYAMYGIDDGPDPTTYCPSTLTEFEKDPPETLEDIYDESGLVVGRTSPLRKAIDASEVVKPCAYVGAVWGQEPE